jgi:hypothetical protein
LRRRTIPGVPPGVPAMQAKGVSMTRTWSASWPSGPSCPRPAASCW